MPAILRQSFLTEETEAQLNQLAFYLNLPKNDIINHCLRVGLIDLMEWCTKGTPEQIAVLVKAKGEGDGESS